MAPVAVEDAPWLAHLPANIHKGELFPDPNVRVGRITQDEELKIRKVAAVFETLIGGFQTRHHACWIFVIDRQNNRSQRQLGFDVRIADLGSGRAKGIAPAPLHQEADYRGPEGEGNRKHQDDEQAENGDFNRAETIELQQRKHAPTEHSDRRQDQR